jgi:hypothetical protein
MPVDSGTFHLLIELGASELRSRRNSHHVSSVTLLTLQSVLLKGVNANLTCRNVQMMDSTGYKKI